MGFSVKKLMLRSFGCLEYTGQVPSLCCLESWNPQVSLLTSLNNQTVNNNLIQSMDWSHCRGSTFSHVVSLSQYLCPMFFIFLSARKWRGNRGREQVGKRCDPPQSLHLLQNGSCVAQMLQWALHLSALANTWTLRQRQKVFPKDKVHPHWRAGGSLWSYFCYRPELGSDSSIPSSYS